MVFDGAAPADMLPIDEATERQFNLRLRHPERLSVYADHSRRSAAFRDACPGALLNRPYGPGARAVMDVFPAGQGAPILVFIHGGYWRTLDKDIFSFIAAAYVAAGVTVVMPNYDLAPKATLGAITAQVQGMLSRLVEDAPAFGADPGRIVLSGHSAGGHLAAMAALTGPTDVVRGLAPVSGLFALEPLLRTTVNRDVRMSAEDARSLSPLWLLDRLPEPPSFPLSLLVGGDETDGFKQQSRDFRDAWTARGGAAAITHAPGTTHFTVLDALADPASPTFAAILSMLGRT
ncbi:alpha/beta hydrolase [Azospirillum sp. RWY-5-1]|uniref:Alpha/beta hydrolase n=1 Tax=Azospirillum oleiclasticum TaxID=2735135 RepID=A0ABX2T249_9PROT|nr:alpha/beta hydrolase [Azospirillum oleiclasticum]NYZ11166.1 alpha/beta hydrolase [Azospirillum oleiclasticum]NYZ18328.1 alpha/beta hydrolase [Azospirillum oleiclasticum]